MATATLSLPSEPQTAIRHSRTDRRVKLLERGKTTLTHYRIEGVGSLYIHPFPLRTGERNMVLADIGKRTGVEVTRDMAAALIRLNFRTER